MLPFHWTEEYINFKMLRNVYNNLMQIFSIFMRLNGAMFYAWKDNMGITGTGHGK